MGGRCSAHDYCTLLPISIRCHRRLIVDRRLYVKIAIQSSGPRFTCTVVTQVYIGCDVGHAMSLSETRR